MIPTIGSKILVNEAEVGTTLKDGLLAILSLNEISGTTAFDSHSTHDFTNSNATINQSGILDKSYLFNGSNAQLNNISSLGSQITLSNTVTVSFWFNATLPVASDGVFINYGTLFSNKSFYIYYVY